jgi:hypothetical protein
MRGGISVTSSSRPRDRVVGGRFPGDLARRAASPVHADV